MTHGPYVRPLVQVDAVRPASAVSVAGGWGWFTHAEVLHRTGPSTVIPVSEVASDVLHAISAPRAPVAGMAMDAPRVMGILNATPDSFSDGGKHAAVPDAVRAGEAMVAAGADLLDIGGESTRPGADFIPAQEEARRVAPVIDGLRDAGVAVPISVDTRKTAVAQAALAAGADLVNDVSGFTFDAGLAPLCAQAGVPVCVMHAQGDPATMQQDPHYDNVVLDVFDFLDEQITELVAQGIARDRIIADPGIGFGKTLAHNLALLSKLSLFHALGVPILLGASRKRFIGTISGVTQAEDRVAGSVAVAQAALGHGIQVLRVHDVAQTKQAIAMWRAVTTGQVT